MYSTAPLFHQVDGTAPNRVLTIEWSALGPDGGNGGLPSNGLQVKLYETSGTIEFIYLQHNLAGWERNDFTGSARDFAAGGGIGLNGFSPQSTSPNSTFFMPSFIDLEYARAQTVSPATDLRFIQAYPYDFSADVITNPANNSIKSINVSQVPTVQITNKGLNVPTSVTVRFQITPRGGGAPIYTHDSVMTGANVPGAFQSALLQFPSFTPTAYNLYEDTVTVFNMQPVSDYAPSDNVTTSEFTVSPQNNIAALEIFAPTPNSRTPNGLTTPVAMEFKNIGGNDQHNVKLSAVVKNSAGAAVYRDTVIVQNWPSNTILDTSFKDWVPNPNGVYTVCGIALLANDELRADDTICTTSTVRYQTDAAAIAIVNPQPDEEKAYTTSWQPAALFQSVGAADLFDIRTQVQIRRCSDDAVVFQADSTIPELNQDEGQVLFKFPSKQGPYDISTLDPGCYRICAIARHISDGNTSNDTVCSEFTIIDRLKGDIFVGVGQRFQSIHAAADSLLFRGVGANVRLILTDNNYTENGTYRVSSNNAAIDLTQVRGLADTATVTWMPNVGVSPHIVFTGNKPFCFYFGDLFGGHMTFDGYGPAGAPIPDQLVPELNKRSITIVNNSTSAGGVFAFEEGASNITLKNLRLTSNGMFANDSSSVVRLYDDQSPNIYAIGKVHDTMPIHNIRVENCELGNAKYGIWDRGLHDLLNNGNATFVSWRNHDNVFARNTIGTSAAPIGKAGIQFNNEQDLMVSHNEVSNVRGALGGYMNVYGIAQPSVLHPDTGNVVRVWVDGNRIHNLSSAGSAYGIAFQQASTIYATGGLRPAQSVLPVVTENRTTNNMVYDMRGAASNYPLVYTTSSATYSTDKDSIFNNSISTSMATVNVFVAQAKHAFLWNNIIQNTGAGPYTNYMLQLPRPFESSVSSDYNLFDLRGTKTFATVNEYDLISGAPIQTRTFQNLNDWRTYTQQDVHSLTGDPLFAADSLHMPGDLSFVESPASNSGAWLGTSSQLRDFDGDLRTQANPPDIGADEFEGFQPTDDLAVLSITAPAGFSASSDTTSVTVENPMLVAATVKNLSSQPVFNTHVTAMVEVALNGGAYSTIYTSTSPALSFEANESKNVAFAGPTLTAAQAHNGIFRVTVSVPNDQNNSNNIAQKIYRVLLKQQATLVSYTSAEAFGLKNRDSVTAALRRLGVAYDSLDRSTFGSTAVDYAPWWTLIWASGDPGMALTPLHRVTLYTPVNFTATWTDITATGTPFTYVDDGTLYNGPTDEGIGLITLPFDFQYDGRVVPAGSVINASTNGAIILSPIAPAQGANGNYNGPAWLGSPDRPAMIAYDLADHSVANPIDYYQVSGTSPNRVLTIEQRLNGPLEVQVKLYEGSGQIEVIYNEHSSTAGYGGNGLQGFTTPTFVYQAYNNTLTEPTTPATDIRWVPPSLPPAGLGSGALNFQETQDVERYLKAGQTYGKKSLIMAGQNIAFYQAFAGVNNSITDTEFMNSYLHTRYRANSPTGGAYAGPIRGMQTDYWTFADNIVSASPDVVAPTFTTPLTGIEIAGLAYTYVTHPSTPADSGAGTTYVNPKINTVFYAFDWSDPIQTTPSEAGNLTSGTTRILRGALDFISSHSGTILPVEFTGVKAVRVAGNGLITWQTAHQADVAQFEIESHTSANTDWTTVGSVSSDHYAFTHTGIDPTQTYTYRIAAIDLSGAKTYSPEAELGPDAGTGFTLEQNYPNPVSGLTSIRFTLPVSAVVTLRVLDVTGKVVSTEIANQAMSSGSQSYTLDASKLSSGSYLYELTAVEDNGQMVTLSKKMTLDK